MKEGKGRGRERVKEFVAKFENEWNFQRRTADHIPLRMRAHSSANGAAVAQLHPIHDLVATAHYSRGQFHLEIDKKRATHSGTIATRNVDDAHHFAASITMSRTMSHTMSQSNDSQRAILNLHTRSKVTDEMLLNRVLVCINQLIARAHESSCDKRAFNDL